MSTSPDKTPLNYPITRDYYFELCRSRPSLLAHSVDHNALGPMVVPFQKRGSPTKGFPLRELLQLENAGFLEDAYNEDIRVFHDEGVPELRLVIWGPDRRRGCWFHHIRRLPTVASTARLTNKAALAHLIAVEYFSFCSEANSRREATDKFPEMRAESLNLVSLRRICGNVYQVELAPSGPARGRGTF